MACPECERLQEIIEERNFEIAQLEDQISEMDMQASFLGGFVDYLKKAGHWAYAEKYFISFFSILEERKQAATQALRGFIFTQEGRGDLF